ncbi:hypothetical protein [Hydrotalea sp.]|uniref:hypothetical protein n=1 Tax=Hydrotalea sp. TaxID=2881279 RepID=UPI003D13CD63
MLKYLLVLFLLPLFTMAQTPIWVNKILNNNLIRVPVYSIDTISTHVLYLSMPFGQSNFLDTNGVSHLQNADILSVDLVFTDYPTSNNLFALNAARFKSLLQLIPFIHNQIFTQWRVIRQMDGKDAASAALLRHGFVIHYRSWVTAETRKQELMQIKQTATTLKAAKQTAAIAKSITTSEPNRKQQKIRYWDEIYGSTSSSSIPTFYINNRPLLQVADTPFIHLNASDSSFSIPTNIAIQKRILTRRQLQQYQKAQQLYCLVGPPRKWEDDAPKRTNTSTNTIISLPDTSLLHSLKNLPCKNVLLIADVTASMSLYTIQLLHWLQQMDSLHCISSFACFNDGDDIVTEKKVLGNTGGIYTDKYTNMAAAADLMELAMQKGSGGDTPENVCEAIIKAIEACNSCEEVFLIADNWAPVRDIVLVNKIKKPIQILVCGGQIGVHPDYVTIAANTGGSLHFPNLVVKDFSALKNGGVLKIRSLQYKLNQKGMAEVVPSE